MSVPITVLGVTSLWPTTGDTGYSAQAEQLQKLLAQAVLPIADLYNSTTGLVGNLGYSDLGELTLNGTPITGLGNLTVTSNNGITSSLTNVDGDYSLTLGLGNITPSKVSITAATGSDGLVLNNSSLFRAPLTTSLATGTRSYFQTTDANSRTVISAVPTGTPGSTSVSGFNTYNTSDPANSASVLMGIHSTSAYLQTAVNGTGINVPLVVGTGSGTALTVDTSNNVEVSNNLEFTGLGKTISGDFSNATATNRLAFQTNTTNGATRLEVRPNGTSTTTNLNLGNSSDSGNTSLFSVFSTSTRVGLASNIRGTGTVLPFNIDMNNVTKFTMDTSGNSSFVGTLSASNLSGTNTGDQTLNSLLPSQTGNAGKVLATDGSNAYWENAAAGSGTVTSVSVVTANGISGTVATPTTTPAITLALGDITPNKVTIGQATGSAGLVFTNGSSIEFAGTVAADTPYFTSSVVNGASRVRNYPNGTSTTSALTTFNSSDKANNAFAALYATSTTVGIQGSVVGTGTQLPLVLVNGSTIGLQVETNANVTIPTNLSVTGAITSTDSVQFDTAATPTAAVGKLMWDATDGTLQFGLAGGNVNLQIGQEQVVYVMNDSGSNMLDSQVVYINGASGNRPTVRLAQANSETTSKGTIGFLTENINNNQQGFVTTSGIVHDVNTGGFADGDVLYLSASTAGGYTNVKPSAPNHVVTLGYVIRAHATVGQIYVKVDNGYELDELHNVLITPPVTTGEVLAYNASTTVWENTTSTAALSMPGINFTGTGSRITGDFSNATSTNRTQIQTSTTNNGTAVSIIPNGTSTSATLNVENNSVTGNNALLTMWITNTTAIINSSKRGTGTTLPLEIGTNGTSAITVDTSNVVSFTNAVTGFVTPNVQGPTSVTGTATVNWANKDVTKLTLTGNTAITNSGAVDGQKMILQLVQGGTGAYTVTFTSETKFGTSFTSITLSTAVGTMDMVGLVYSAVNSKYNIVSFAAGY